ncbi:hypothetical protein [Streptomyces sp. UG1]|uniref:hypothetical protein n=1 Tax=Streptomyces sp. UG1 TaxID=3417652 RepID=UPI003CFA4F79
MPEALALGPVSLGGGEGVAVGGVLPGGGGGGGGAAVGGGHNVGEGAVVGAEDGGPFLASSVHGWTVTMVTVAAVTAAPVTAPMTWP